MGSHDAARVAGSLGSNGAASVGRARTGDSVQAFISRCSDLQVGFGRLVPTGERVWLH